MRYSYLIYIPKIKIIPMFGREGEGRDIGQMVTSLGS